MWKKRAQSNDLEQSLKIQIEMLNGSLKSEKLESEVLKGQIDDYKMQLDFSNKKLNVSILLIKLFSWM